MAEIQGTAVVPRGVGLVRLLPRARDGAMPRAHDVSGPNLFFFLRSDLWRLLKFWEYQNARGA